MTPSWLIWKPPIPCTRCGVCSMLCFWQLIELNWNLPVAYLIFYSRAKHNGKFCLYLFCDHRVSVSRKSSAGFTHFGLNVVICAGDSNNNNKDNNPACLASWNPKSRKAKTLLLLSGQRTFLFNKLLFIVMVVVVAAVAVANIWILFA